jgi:hypothetical protein
MTVNALSPAFVQIFYHSLWSPHVMTRPTRAWSPPAGGFTNGSFLAWNDSQRDADDMIKDFVNLAKVLFPADVVFDNYAIYIQSGAEAPPVLRAVGDLSIAGTFVGDAQQRAVQAHYAFKDTEGAIAKIVLLDIPLPATFEPVNSLGALTADEEALMDNFLSSTEAWASRNDQQPFLFRRATYKLNDALRNAYRMA